ncbi:MAG: succinate dehydrogenase, cytochrome b556 subunit [Steroidobacteraceae bacterium]
MSKSSARPLSPHLQIYRPQLTSVLSFTHRLTGVTLGIYSIALVAWLIAAAAGPQPYSNLQTVIRSWPGQVLLIGGTFCFFLHLCGGIRHLFWDTGRGFELRAIYSSGWAMVAVSTVLTAAAWIVSLIMSR